MSSGLANAPYQLLGPDDPPPVEIVNADSDHGLVMLCEHAGRAIPRRLGDLGISKHDRERHIAWDIGAAGVSRHMADILGAPLIMQAYSRLVIDCNRPPHSGLATPVISDDSRIPANETMDHTERAARVTEIFEPLDDALTELLIARPRRLTASIHSFNPVLAGVRRPWDIGFLYRRDPATAERLASWFRQQVPDLTIGMNEPYQIDEASDWFVVQHAEPSGLAHGLIEIRNDHLHSDAQCRRWAEWLAAAFRELPEYAV